MERLGYDNSPRLAAHGTEVEIIAVGGRWKIKKSYIIVWQEPMVGFKPFHPPTAKQKKTERQILHQINKFFSIKDARS